MAIATDLGFNCPDKKWFIIEEKLRNKYWKAKSFAAMGNMDKNQTGRT